jgi:leucyl aminopeptidase
MSSLGFGPARGVEIAAVTAAECADKRNGPLARLPAGAELMARVHGFTGASGEVLLLPNAAGELPRILLGIGDGQSDAVRRAFAAFRRKGDKLPAWSFRLAATAPEVQLTAAAEGWWLGGYAFERFKGKSGRGEEKAEGGDGVFLPAGDLTQARGEAILARVAAVMTSVALSRDLVNTPAGDLWPEGFCDLVQAVAVETGMQFRAWRGDEVEQAGFGMLAAVGKGSARRPCLARLELGAARPGVPVLALVGKGVTFDSGGLDIKSADAMELMKKDMAGAATVLGCMRALAQIAPALPVRAYLPMAENMTGERAFRPGDVLRSRAGLTVEIGNTDAEGRLLLGDALALAVEEGATRILDIATLTGACRVALGKKIMGLFSNEDRMAAVIQEEADATGELVWRLPLFRGYARLLDSHVADLNNSGKDRFGGAITAALFLERFVKQTPWAHLDCYAWTDAAEPGYPVGASGTGVRLLVRVAERLAAG